MGLVEDMSAPESPPTQAPDIYAVFCGPIDEAATQRLLGGLTMATRTPGTKHVHLLFQTTGGCPQRAPSEGGGAQKFG